jgi:hypothetical protein
MMLLSPPRPASRRFSAIPSYLLGVSSRDSRHAFRQNPEFPAVVASVHTHG